MMEWNQSTPTLLRTNMCRPSRFPRSSSCGTHSYTWMIIKNPYPYRTNSFSNAENLLDEYGSLPAARRTRKHYYSMYIVEPPEYRTSITVDTRWRDEYYARRRYRLPRRTYAGTFSAASAFQADIHCCCRRRYRLPCRTHAGAEDVFWYSSFGRISRIINGDTRRGVVVQQRQILRNLQ